MLLVDSHCHLDRLDLTPYHGDLSLALAAAKAQQVGYYLCVSIDSANFPNVLAIAEAHPQVFASMGVHPTEHEASEIKVAEIIQLGSAEKVVAIGETGLDYYRCEGDMAWQRQRFRNHIRAARELAKPLIIHTRDAAEDTLAILQEERACDVGGVLHCFTESWEVAQRAMAMNFYISLSGIVTFKNALALQAIAKQMPLERLLIETDAPYLAPMPFRGKPNEPAYVRYVAEAISRLREQSLMTIAAQTTANFFQLFKAAQV